MKSLEIKKGEFINLDNVNEIVFKEDEQYYRIHVTFSNGTGKKWKVRMEIGKLLEQQIRSR